MTEVAMQQGPAAEPPSEAGDRCASGLYIQEHEKKTKQISAYYRFSIGHLKNLPMTTRGASVHAPYCGYAPGPITVRQAHGYLPSRSVTAVWPVPIHWPATDVRVRACVNNLSSVITMKVGTAWSRTLDFLIASSQL